MFGKLFFTIFIIFLSTNIYYLKTEFRELMPLVISVVPAWVKMQSGLTATNFSVSSNIFFEVPTGKFLTVTDDFLRVLFTYSVKKGVIHYNNFFLLVYCNCMRLLSSYDRFNTVTERILVHTSFLTLILQKNSERL